MSLLDKLEQKLGRFGVPHVTIALIACQIIVFATTLAQRVPDEPNATLENRLTLVPERVVAGEVWRLATFVTVPPCGSILCLFFYWYLFYLMGTALEGFWGVFRYNVYLLIGYCATVAAAFLPLALPAVHSFLPAHSAGTFLQSSVFLAFAFLNPDFELYLFCIMPVRIKWLALIAWITYGLYLLFGNWLTRALVLASVCNFLVFFGADILHKIRAGRRRMARQAARFATKPPPYYHRCTVCGITDRSHRDMEFRYCSKCSGAHGYCMAHLLDHEHITTPEPAAES